MSTHPAAVRRPDERRPGPRVALLYVEPTSYILSDIDHIRSSLPGLHFDVFFLEKNLSANWDVAVNPGARLIFEPCEGFLGRLRSLWGLLDRLDPTRYEAALLQGYWPWPWAVILAWCRWRGLPTIMSSDTQLPVEGGPVTQAPKRGLRRTLKRAVLTRFLRLSAFFLPAGSRQWAYFAHYGVPAERMRVHHMTVNVGWFKARAEEARADRVALRRRLGLPEDAIVLVYVGRLVARKAPSVLLEAYAKVRREFPACRLVLVGEGPERQGLASLAGVFGVEVRLAGFQQGLDLVDWYAAADVFVLPSLQEPWGLVINEALACGLPVVTTDAVGAVDDLVHEGENGYVVTAGDAPALSRALRRLVSSSELRRRMGEASRRVISGWTHKESVAAFAAALETVRPGLTSASPGDER